MKKFNTTNSPAKLVDFGAAAAASRWGAGLGLLAVVGGLWLSGCARQANLTTAQLPLRRVVIYRNGVAYFERGGEVDADRVTFQMRPKMIGDFLATLAVMQEGGSSVSSASFPVEVEKDSVEDPEVEHFRRQLSKADNEPEKDEDLREVVLRMGEGKHNLSIGYVAETPLWKPSYRLVLNEAGKAQLQVWGIVQNLSGEDWENVELALVAGAPIAFESTLGTPVTPTRPVVSDSGEVIAAVPSSMTTYKEEAPAAAPPAPPMAAPADQAEMMASDEEAMPEEKGRVLSGTAAFGAARAPAASRKEAPPMGRSKASVANAPAPKPMPSMVPSAPRNLNALASVAAQTGSTRYEVGTRVTIPDESATMVMLLNQTVPGEAVFLFAPDGGVPDSSVHPFRVVRFVNSGKGLLEGGPIAVFEKGAFLGQGVMDSLSPESKATVPFALQRSLTVNQSSNFSQEGARVSKIEAGRLYIERDQVRLTNYEIKNGSEEAGKLLVRHFRDTGWRLHNPPKGTEDRTTDGHALVPVSAPPHATTKLVVDERLSIEQELDWLDPLADIAVRAYWDNPKSEPKSVAQLKQAWGVRADLSRIRDRLNQLTATQAELEKAARESRLSLEAIEKNTQAADLRATLTARLREQTAGLDRASKELIEVKLKQNELEVRLRDALRDLSVQLPPTSGR
ncbi:MAG: DUF4139 domain-containing protein [Polyangiaceae bacterium]|nr:DUF4139 domain-containing protein [Polyangiaceae bacterium]